MPCGPEPWANGPPRPRFRRSALRERLRLQGEVAFSSPGRAAIHLLAGRQSTTLAKTDNRRLAELNLWEGVAVSPYPSPSCTSEGELCVKSGTKRLLRRRIRGTREMRRGAPDVIVLGGNPASGQGHRIAALNPLELLGHRWHVMPSLRSTSRASKATVPRPGGAEAR